MFDREAVKSFWDDQATKESFTTHGAGMLLRNQVLVDVRMEVEAAIVKEMLRAFQIRRVLDVGCGTGRWSFWFAERGCQVIGIDRSHEMISLCKRHQQEAGIQSLTFHCRDANDWKDFGDFELVFAGGVLQYMEDHEVESFTKEAGRHLAKDGLCLTRDSVLPRTMRSTTQCPVIYRTPEAYLELFASQGFKRQDHRRAFVYPQLMSKLPPWVRLPKGLVKRFAIWDGILFRSPPISWLLPLYSKLTGRGLGRVPDHRFSLYRRV